MAIYPENYRYNENLLKTIDVGDRRLKIDKKLEIKVFGNYVVGWMEGLDNTLQMFVSNNEPSVERCTLTKDVFKELIKRINATNVEYLWYALYARLGRFIKVFLRSESDGLEYIKKRLGAIVMLKMMHKLPVERNIEKIKERGGWDDSAPHGYIGIYRMAVGFMDLKEATILVDGISVTRQGFSETLTDEFAEKLYSIFDPLIDDEMLRWWATLYKRAEKISFLYLFEEA